MNGKSACRLALGLGVLLTLASCPSPVGSPTPGGGGPHPGTVSYGTNGDVFTQHFDPASNTLYIGGDFTFVGPRLGGGVPLNALNGQLTVPPTTLSKVEGTVFAVVSDGSGGWYIGGSFSRVGSQTRNNLARINSDGSVAAWNPNANGIVVSLAVSGSGPGTIVYAGGMFTLIGGGSRNNIAALEAATGNATAWNPGVNGPVGILAVSGSTVYAVGVFSFIGGQTRNGLAALDAATGNATAWNPNANGSVNTLAVSGATVYVGGWFTEIGGQSRNHIAALDAVSGNATAWAPNPNGGVASLAVSGSTVYVGGWFTSIAGADRFCIAALDAVTGNATTWNPKAIGGVRSLSVSGSGSTVYAAGGFTSIGGQGNPHIAALDSITGEVLWE